MTVPYRDEHGESGEGFAFVDVDGQSLFDLDGIPNMNVAANHAACYLITGDAEAWHARMTYAGLAVTEFADQAWACASSRSRTHGGITCASATASPTTT